MTDLIPLSLLEQPEIKAAFTKTARTDLLQPMIIFLNQLNSLLNGDDPTSSRSRLNALANAVQSLQTIDRPSPLITILIVNLTNFQALVNEVEQIRQTLNTVVTSLKDVKVPT